MSKRKSVFYGNYILYYPSVLHSLFHRRLNEGNVKRHTFARLDDMIAAAGKRRITYKQLIGKEQAV